MDWLAFPLRIGSNGWFQRSPSADDAVGHLLEVMGRTPGDGGWRGVKEFGLRDHLMTMGTRRGLQPEAIQSANRVLADLGIDWFSVISVEKEDGKSASEANYSVSVLFKDRGTEILRVRM